jgi:hypothetical protein
LLAPAIIAVDAAGVPAAEAELLAPPVVATAGVAPVGIAPVGAVVLAEGVELLALRVAGVLGLDVDKFVVCVPLAAPAAVLT